MKLVADLSAGKLLVNGAEYSISNRIRTVRDGTRKSYDVTRSVYDDLPYDPQPFPKGLWEITGVDWQEVNGKKMFDHNTYGPAKIRTNAWQLVNVWELDKDGDYLRETERKVKDHCYHLHYSVSNTTLGCIRLASCDDAVQIARVLEKLMGKGEKIQLEVV
jgi:hypothetical protein